MLAGLLFGSGGSTGGMDAGTVTGGLTGGMANLLMTLTGGLACLAVWRSSLNFRLGKRPDWKWIPPLFSWRPPCPWGLTLSSLISVWHSIPRPFSRWQRNRPPYRCGWESAIWIRSAFFRGTGIPGNYLWEIQRSIRRACCHGIFRRGFRHLPREPGAGDICFPAWHHACLGDGTIRHTFGSRYFSWDRESCCFFPYRCGRAGEYPCAAACMRGAAGNFRRLLLVSGYR